MLFEGEKGRPTISLEGVDLWGCDVTPSLRSGSGEIFCSVNFGLASAAVRRGSTHLATMTVVVVGLALTAALAWTSWSLDDHNEGRLLNLQAKQVEAVLQAAIPATEIPLEVGAAAAQASDGNVDAFRSSMSGQLEAKNGFSAVSLWRRTTGTMSLVTTIGTPHLDQSSAQARAVISRALISPTFVVVRIPVDRRQYLGYAFALPGPQSGQRFVVYAERALPANRRARVASNTAFSDLDYAIYLGHEQTASRLLATDLTQLPITQRSAVVVVPFGDTVLTTVVTARAPLGGNLSAELPWIVGVVGVLLTIGAAVLTERLVRRRHSAERAETEVRQVYAELEALYGQQRTIAETLQRALLPPVLPDIPGVETAAHYLPGAQGVDIGGDWYSVLDLGGGRFFFVVGDVSGRGVTAASIMARLKFTVRAHAVDGDDPATVLNKCSKQLNIEADRHIASILLGVCDLRRHEIILANAGHLPPLLVSDGHSEFIQTPLGVPVGVVGDLYRSITVSVAPSATLIAFTDGLVERRHENLDAGLKRLEEAVGSHIDRPLEELISRVLDELDGYNSEDDIAILALRWNEHRVDMEQVAPGDPSSAGSDEPTAKDGNSAPTARVAFEIHPSGETIIRLIGELDLASAPYIRAELDAHLIDRSSKVVADLEDLVFMDSSGIALLIEVQNRVGSLEVRNATSNVRRVLKATGLLERFGLSP